MSVIQNGRDKKGARGLGPWLAKVAPRSARGTVSIAILSDAKVRSLNRRFRHKDAVTDVLSFTSQGPFPGGTHLGDIVIARGLAQRQAKKQRHSLSVEFRVLALHGLLHLLGYDHEVDDGDMARAETRLRRRAGLPLGLIARSS